MCPNRSEAPRRRQSASGTQLLRSTRFDGRAQGLDRRRAVLRPQAGLSPARAAACAASGPSLAKARWVTPTALFTLAAEPADSLRRMTLLLSRLWRFRFAPLVLLVPGASGRVR